MERKPITKTVLVVRYMSTCETCGWTGPERDGSGWPSLDALVHRCPPLGVPEALLRPTEERKAA